MMSFLNNLKIVTKVGLIVVVLSLVIVGCLGLSMVRMTGIVDEFRALISKEDAGTLALARAGRRAESYRAAAYAVLTETTEAENAKQLQLARTVKAEFNKLMNDAKVFDAKSSEIARILTDFNAAFDVCDPVIVEGSKAATVEQNAKVAEKLHSDCSPKLDTGITELTKFLDATVVDVQEKSKETSEAAQTTTKVVIGLAIAGMLVGIVVALFIGIVGLARPLASLKNVMEALARRDLAVEVSNKDRRDEVGDMARTLEVFKRSAIEIEQMKKEQVESEKLAAEFRRSEMLKLADSFESAVGEIIETVGSASTELEASANVLTNTAQRAQEVTSIVASASEETSANVQSVASATEELASSITEIGRQVQVSTAIAGEAVDQAKAANDRVAELTECASRIGHVVELISTIASQTNLLALNATIEAARAGDAGRGFAVVASEVKSLADQTAKATGEISHQVDAIRAATEESATTLQGIATTIGRMSEIATTIASAVEEQGAATQEIARNVQQAAEGTKDVTSNVIDVQKGAAETGSASSQVLSAAKALSQDSASLKLQVHRFLETVRAA